MSKIKKFWPWLLCLLFWVVIAFAVTGCGSTKYIEVPVEKVNYVERHDTLLRTDSIIQRDSVLMFAKGDTITIYKTKYIDRLKFVYKTKVDTVYERRDSTIVKEVPRAATVKDKFLEGMGGLFMALMGIVVLFGALRIIARR